jgi:hypothetical protein
MDVMQEGAGKALSKNTTTAKLTRLGIDKAQILGKRTVKAPSHFVVSATDKKAADPFKSERAKLMPLFNTVMKEAPHVKLTSPERRKVLNAVAKEHGAEVAEHTVVRLSDALKKSVHDVLMAREQRARKVIEGMDLDDLLANLTVTKKRKSMVKAPAVADHTAQAAKAALQAEERAHRYERREQLRAKLEQLKANHHLDMDVDVLVQAMGDADMNLALSMNEDDLLDAFKSLKFGGGKRKNKGRK